MVKIAINKYLYQSVVPVSLSIASARQLHGKELSYNNIRDADAALRIASEFTEPTVVAVKHMNHVVEQENDFGSLSSGI